MEAIISSLFEAVLEMSVTASVVILSVALLRLFLKKMPKSVSYGLWFVALFRLLCPVSFKSAISAMNIPGILAQTQIPGNSAAMAYPPVVIFVPAASGSVLPAAEPYASADPVQIILFVLAVVWLMGIAALLLYGGASYLRLKLRLRTATRIRDNIYRSDMITSPFVLGYLSPKIYLSVFLKDGEKDYIIRHEETHIRRGDHIIKALWFAALCIHWFNPLVWLAERLMTRDMEMSCDEAVLREFGEDIKADYSASLLALSAPGKLFSGGPLAFGETGVKARIKNILNYKRPAFWAVAAAIAAAVILSAALAADPEEKKAETMADRFLQYKTEYVGDNSKVGGMISLLEFPEGVEYSSFSLQTNMEPYGITVELAAEDLEALFRAKESPQFGKNAAILLSLTGNAEYVAFHLTGADHSLDLSYTRDWVEEQYGQDVRLFSESAEEMNRLIYGDTPEEALPEVAYGLMKLEKGEVIFAMSPLSGEAAELARDVIMNYMFRSTLLPGEDIKTLDECYLIRADYGDTVSEYYAYVSDGRTLLQAGAEGFCAAIDDGLYAGLALIYEKSETARIVEENLAVIMSSPKASSNPGDYIKAHPEEHEAIMDLGDEAADYMRARIDAGEGGGLKGSVMRLILEDITAGGGSPAQDTELSKETESLKEQPQ